MGLPSQTIDHLSGECIADRDRHGPAILELLKDIDVVAACHRAVPGIHTIWELVEHITVWDAASIVRLAGEKSQPTGATRLADRKNHNSIFLNRFSFGYVNL